LPSTPYGEAIVDDDELPLAGEYDVDVLHTPKEYVFEFTGV